jgi:hypothetical protein
MTAATSSNLGNLLAGRQCKVVKRESDWNFNFGEGLNVTASVPWRIVTPNGIAHGDRDDGQWFGLRQPVDGEARANALLRERSVVAVEADELTADLQITFDDGVRLDLFNDSSGYEGWQADLSRDSAQPLTIVAMGGGGFTIFSD